MAALALLAGSGPRARSSPAGGSARARAGGVEPPVHLDGGGRRPDPPALPPNVARLAAIRDVVWSLALPSVEAPLHEGDVVEVDAGGGRCASWHAPADGYPAGRTCACAPGRTTGGRTGPTVPRWQ